LVIAVANRGGAALIAAWRWASRWCGGESRWRGGDDGSRRRGGDDGVSRWRGGESRRRSWRRGVATSIAA
jgi:hypothetical protein